MHHHILIIGGTGMLKSASITLARKCHLLTSITSTNTLLSTLDKGITALQTKPLQ
jgi:hypothetical protein